MNWQSRTTNHTIRPYKSIKRATRPIDSGRTGRKGVDAAKHLHGPKKQQGARKVRVVCSRAWERGWSVRMVLRGIGKNGTVFSMGRGPVLSARFPLYVKQQTGKTVAQRMEECTWPAKRCPGIPTEWISIGRLTATIVRDHFMRDSQLRQHTVLQLLVIPVLCWLFILTFKVNC